MVYTAERYVELWRDLTDGEAVVLRLANVHGPRQNPEGEAGVVSTRSSPSCDVRSKCPWPSSMVPRPGEQRRSVLDARRAERVLGWKASTSLTDGLRLTVQDARG